MRSRARRDTSSATRAIAIALASALSLFAIYDVFVRTREGQRLDQTALDHVDSSTAGVRVADLLQYLTVGGLATVLVGCVVVALVRRRWALAAGAVVLVGGAIATTEVIKHQVLSRPDFGYGVSNSLPSGHTTVVASLALAALLVVPARGRWLVGLAAAVGIATTGVGTVVAGWHRPSDVVAALAVTLGWGAVVLAGLVVVHGTDATSRPTVRPAALAVGLTLAAAVFLALGVRPQHNATDLGVHVVTMCGLALIGAGVVGLFAWMVDARFR